MKKSIIIYSVLILVSVLIPCNILFAQNNKSVKTAESHSHNEKLPLTSYNDDFEVFAEATPFVAGQPSNILGHFTFLKDYKPLNKGIVTIKMIVGSKEVKQTLKNPTRKGIYQFTLTPPASGIGKITIDITTPQKTSHLILENITVYTTREDAQHAAASVLQEGSNGVVFIKEKSWKIDFATELVKKENGILTVPNEAIIDEKGESYVYIQVTPEYFEKRLIKKGNTNGKQTEIVDGVLENQRIITKGTELVKLEQKKKESESHEGHTH